MGCESGIVKNITSNCTTHKTGGLEVNAYIINRADFEPTFDSAQKNLINNVSCASGKQAYLLKGVNKNLNAGHDMVKAEGFTNTYNHYFSFKQFEVLAEDIENVDNIDDVVVIVETKNKNETGEGVFIAYGVKGGLHKSSDSLRHNADNGTRSIEMTSEDQESELFSHYVVFDTDYATTKAAVEALLTPSA